MLTYPWLNQMLGGQGQGEVSEKQRKRIEVRVQGHFIIVEEDPYIRGAVRFNKRLQSNQADGAEIEKSRQRMSGGLLHPPDFILTELSVWCD